MAVSFVSQASAGANTVSMPTHVAGDLIMVCAYRDGNNTAPTLPSGYTNIQNGGANTNSSRVGYKYARNASETTGTWTNATGVVVVVYRGVGNIGSTPNQASGSANSLSYTALSCDRGDSTSWVVRFGGHRTATNTTTNTPSGGTFTLRGGTATEVAAFDTNGGVTSVGAGTQSVNQNSGFRTHTIELIETAPFTGFTDDFSTGSAPDSAKWENWGGAACTVSGGTARINTGTADGGFFGFEAKSFLPHTLIGNQVSVQVVDAGAGATTLYIYPIELVVWGMDTYSAYLQINNGTVYAYKQVAGSYTNLASASHTNGNYYRIRESGGTLYWEYSTDGITFSTIHSESNPIPLTALNHVIYTGIDGGAIGGGARTVQVDNVNILPNPVPPTITYITYRPPWVS